MFAMVMFSSFISSLADAMTKLRVTNSERLAHQDLDIELSNMNAQLKDATHRKQVSAESLIHGSRWTG